ncbi:MAG: hypothetical protein AB9903_25250 [Vulcanimicrobiota bacterium]
MSTINGFFRSLFHSNQRDASHSAKPETSLSTQPDAADSRGKQFYNDVYVKEGVIESRNREKNTFDASAEGCILGAEGGLGCADSRTSVERMYKWDSFSVKGVVSSFSANYLLVKDEDSNKNLRVAFVDEGVQITNESPESGSRSVITLATEVSNRQAASFLAGLSGISSVMVDVDKGNMEITSDKGKDLVGF